jgi:hypothetical protein
MKTGRIRFYMCRFKAREGKCVKAKGRRAVSAVGLWLDSAGTTFYTLLALVF